jgi:hypothetical protein
MYLEKQPLRLQYVRFVVFRLFGDALMCRELEIDSVGRPSPD